MLNPGTLQELVELACLWEATVPKPGNVYPGASFSDTSYQDFVHSARVISPILAKAHQCSTGQLILEAVCATRQAVGKNTNLGIVLVLAPLAQASGEQHIADILQNLTQADAVAVYEAIRVAQPGGLGQVDSQDVHSPPTVTLLEAMRLAADHDLIARQYNTVFHDVRTVLLERLETELQSRMPDRPWRRITWWKNTLHDLSHDWKWASQAIQATFLHGMATLGDTLIARKCGIEVMNEAQSRAAAVLKLGWPGTQAGQTAWTEYDAWLRADGHRRNPGTMADLLCATLFLCMQRGVIPLTVEVPPGS